MILSRIVAEEICYGRQPAAKPPSIMRPIERGYLDIIGETRLIQQRPAPELLLASNARHSPRHERLQRRRWLSRSLAQFGHTTQVVRVNPAHIRRAIFILQLLSHSALLTLQPFRVIPTSLARKENLTISIRKDYRIREPSRAYENLGMLILSATYR